MKQITFIITCLLVFVGCSNGGSIDKQLTLAEALLENAPDSTLLILDNISSLDELSDEMKSTATMLTAKAKLRKGESFLMVEGLDDALGYYETSMDTMALLDMYQLAAIRMRWLGDQDSASMFLNKAIDIASETTSPSRSELFIELSNLYAMPSLNKDYAKAITYAMDAVKVARTKEERARAMHDIGLFYSFIGHNDSTAIFMERALAETDAADPLFATYALNYASNLASDFKRSVCYDLVRRRMEICIEQFRESRLQADLDRQTMQYRNTGNYPPVKEREAIQKTLIGCFADFIVDLKMTGVRLNIEDIVTCIMSCLRESNATIAACLGATETAIRTRKSRLRAKLPAEMLDLLEL